MNPFNDMRMALRGADSDQRLFESISHRIRSADVFVDLERLIEFFARLSVPSEQVESFGEIDQASACRAVSWLEMAQHNLVLP